MIMAINRVREIRRWLDFRYGEILPEDDAGRDDLLVLINYVVQVNRGDPIGAAVTEARGWAPWLDSIEAQCLAEEALRRPIKFKADTLATRLGVTHELRTLLGFKTIGACDLTRSQRDQAARQRRTDAERDRRRKKGVKPRDEYESKARALRAEAATLGVSYEALRKRMQRSAKARVSQVSGESIRDIQRLPHTWDMPVQS
jgi:hypothetical protein